MESSRIPEAVPNNAWRILVVEPEPTHRLILARLLKRAGYEVDMASNGPEGLEKIRDRDISLMITASEMSGMSGLALCTALRSIETGYTYTILLTNKDAIEHLVAGLQSGADDYLIKPVVEPELIARLNTGRRIVTLERSLRVANEENRRLAIIDALTGCYNRWFMMMQLPREISRAVRLGRPLCLLMCDIDKLKSVNDEYGHTVGSDVLALVARTLNEEVRLAGGWLTHLGGDEFISVLPDIELSRAEALAENQRRRLDNAALKVGGHVLTITASFGLVGSEGALPQDLDLQFLLSCVDGALYQSKANGRNRVSIRQIDTTSGS